jgi:pimeloyl-ACP methyl ester carboxylesterase
MKRIYLIIVFELIMVVNSFSQSTKSTFIFVHGAWFGNYAWKEVTPLLQAKGYKIISFDLPGYGDDKRPSASITLNDYVQKVVDVVTPLKEKVILVGHSMGGAIITQASEVLGPQKVDKLIFLDAFLLKDGESIFAQVEKMNEANRLSGNSTVLKPASEYLIFSEDGKSCLVAPNMITELFCHDCPSEDMALVAAHKIWQPVAALATPVHVTEKRYGNIPKFYIQCTQSRDLDRTSILQNVPCQKVYKLPSSHSPFFSMPDKLVAILDEIYKFPSVAVSQ